MEDSGARSIARVYAHAFIEATASAGMNDAVAELNSFVDDVLSTNPDFDQMLRTPRLTTEAKLSLLDKAIVPRSSELFGNFLRVLAKHNRLDLLPLIRKLVAIEIEHRSGHLRVVVTSAVELSSTTLDSIRNSMATALAAQPILEARIDPSLLGGITIRVGDTVYDGSLKTQVKQLRARLRERYLNEIQRGRDRFSHQD
jgi:F-type H+-transporting ATPase subunit delta